MADVIDAGPRLSQQHRIIRLARCGLAFEQIARRLLGACAAASEARALRRLFDGMKRRGLIPKPPLPALVYDQPPLISATDATEVATPAKAPTAPVSEPITASSDARYTIAIAPNKSSKPAPVIVLPLTADDALARTHRIYRDDMIAAAPSPVLRALIRDEKGAGPMSARARRELEDRMPFRAGPQQLRYSGQSCGLAQ